MAERTQLAVTEKEKKRYNERKIYRCPCLPEKEMHLSVKFDVLLLVQFQQQEQHTHTQFTVTKNKRSTRLDLQKKTKVDFQALPTT